MKKKYWEKIELHSEFWIKSVSHSFFKVTWLGNDNMIYESWKSLQKYMRDTFWKYLILCDRPSMFYLTGSSTSTYHCVKSVCIRNYSGPHFSRIFPHSDRFEHYILQNRLTFYDMIRYVICLKFGDKFLTSLTKLELEAKASIWSIMKEVYFHIVVSFRHLLPLSKTNIFL